MTKAKKQNHNKSPTSSEEQIRPGRKPIYTERMPARTINMPDSMYDRLAEEARFRNLSGGCSEMQRKINTWFFDALDRQRGDAQDNRIFDEVLAITNKQDKEK